MNWRDAPTASTAPGPESGDVLRVELTRDDPGATLPEYWDASIMLEGFASVVGDIAFRTREDAKRWAERMCRVMATVRGW